MLSVSCCKQACWWCCCGWLCPVVPKRIQYYQLTVITTTTTTTTTTTITTTIPPPPTTTITITLLLFPPPVSYSLHYLKLHRSPFNLTPPNCNWHHTVRNTGSLFAVDVLNSAPAPCPVLTNRHKVLSGCVSTSSSVSSRHGISGTSCVVLLCNRLQVSAVTTCRILPNPPTFPSCVCVLRLWCPVWPGLLLYDGGWRADRDRCESYCGLRGDAL